jgi:hypothetical protein
MICEDELVFDPDLPGILLVPDVEDILPVTDPAA